MSAPYKVWDTRKSLGIMRDIRPAFTYWLGLGYSRSINSTDEWIDFEKLPAAGRKLAPFVRPLAAGKAIYEDRSSGYGLSAALVIGGLGYGLYAHYRANRTSYGAS